MIAVVAKKAAAKMEMMKVTTKIQMLLPTTKQKKHDKKNDK